MALQFIRRARLLAVAGLIAVSLAAPLAASAAEGGGNIGSRYSDRATLDVTGVTYNSRLMVTVTFRVVCDSLEFFDWQTGQTVVLTEGTAAFDAGIIQAQGRSIVGANGYATAQVTCDGATVNDVSVPILASSAPFRKGGAVTGGSVFVCQTGGGTCWASAGTGPVEVKLR